MQLITSWLTTKETKSPWLKWIVLSTASVGLFVYFANKMKIKSHPSIPWITDPHPYLGHIPFFVKNFHRINDALETILNSPQKEQSPINCLYIAGNYDHYITSPELVQWVFSTEFNKFKKCTKKDLEVSEIIFGKYGDGIFMSDGDEWRFHRKISARMFSIRNVRGFMYDCCMHTNQKMMLKLQKLQNTENFAIVDINDLLGRMTFDCFTTIAFGVKFNSMSLFPEIHPFGNAFDTVMRLLIRRYFDIFSPIKKILNIGFEKRLSECDVIINGVCDEILLKRKNVTDEKSFDLLSLYISHNPQLTDYQLKKIALHFITAGRDSTRLLLSWFLYDMCCFPQFKKQLYSEIDAIDDEHKNEDDEKYFPSYHLVSNFANGLQFLECCLCESLRFHPPATLGFRVAKEDIEIPTHVLYPNGKCNEHLEHEKRRIIRKGEKIVILHPCIARNKAFFDDPNEYQPGRYQSKGVRTFPTNVFTFFNLQPRLCLGRDFALMEAKIFVYHFFKRYDFELVPGQEIVSTPGLLSNMANGMKLKFSLRN